MSRPFRHTFILVLVALATVLAAAGGWRYARASAPVNGPIVLISIDSLRADHLPAYGYRKIATPAIDALAADGIVFERAYSHAPLTLPAHVSLLTGRLPYDTGVRDNAGFTVKPDERLIAEMLRDRGYSTAGVVSSFVLRKETGIGRGFEFFDSAMQPAPPDAAIGELRRDGSDSEQIAEKWLATANTSRALLFLHLDEPHQPWSPPERYSSYEPYDAEIAYADEIVGRLLKYLKTHQLYDRSTIFLVSDHGEGLGDHGESGHGLFVYDEAIHVPLIVKQAGGEGAGRRVSALAEHVDVTPTILDLAKAPVPGNLRGRSLRPLLSGTGDLGARTAYAESMYGRYHFGWSALTTLTDGRHQYVRAPTPELYNLDADPHERQNLAGAAAGASAPAPDRDSSADSGVARASDPTASQPSQHADAETVLARYAKQLAALPEPDARNGLPDVSADDRERFEALGIVGWIPVDADISLSDPKDESGTLEIYRDAMRLASTRRWAEALTSLQELVSREPDSAALWQQIGALAFRAGRDEQAVKAFRRMTALTPDDPRPHVAAADALLRIRKLDEARVEARAALDAPETEASTAAAAHELLARIALAHHDAETVRSEAALARDAVRAPVLPPYFEGRLLSDQGRYEEAVTAFEAAVAELPRSNGRLIQNLHFYFADALLHLERSEEAETELLEELRLFPQNAHAWSALVTLYRAAGRTDEAAQAVADLIRVDPTPDGYATAERLLAAAGDRKGATALRAARK